MRLSDWSSDVCSSDLRHRSRRRDGTDEPGHDDAVADNHVAAVQAAAVRPRRRLGADDGQPRQFVHDLSRNTMEADYFLKVAHEAMWVLALAAVQIMIPILLAGQIGRASCRDRVCQYEQICVVVV